MTHIRETTDDNTGAETGHEPKARVESKQSQRHRRRKSVRSLRARTSGSRFELVIWDSEHATALAREEIKYICRHVQRISESASVFHVFVILWAQSYRFFKTKHFSMSNSQWLLGRTKIKNKHNIIPQHKAFCAISPDNPHYLHLHKQSFLRVLLLFFF